MSEPASVIKAVCWDVGGVFTASPHAAIAAAAAEHGLTAEVLSETVFGDLGGDGEHPWYELEKGRLPLSEAWPLIEQRIAALGVDVTLRDLFRRMGNDPFDRTVVHATARDCAASGLSMAVITNNVREFADLGEGRGWQRMVPMELMSVVVDSSAVGMRKPDAEIYEHLLAEVGVDPDQAVLVDDTAVNIDGATAVGMQTVLVGEDPAPAMAELRALVGLS